MIAVASTAAMLRAMRTAHEVTLSSYVLPPGPVERGLEDAARRGARVTVRLNGYFYGGRSWMLQANESAVRRLKRLHADAAIVHRRDRDGACLHLKAAVCDGVAFLDDCNWRADGRDTILRDDGPAAVGAIRRAASGDVRAAARGIALDKASALSAEAALLRASRGPVDVEAESIGFWSVYSALKRLAQHGAACRLLISKYGATGKSGHAAALLARAGVRVRVAPSDEKFAVAGGTAWIGSANPTSAFLDGDEVEWGIRTRRADVVNALASRFNAAWKAASPLPKSEERARVP